MGTPPLRNHPSGRAPPPWGGGKAPLTADVEVGAGRGVAQGVPGHADVLPRVLRPHGPQLQAEGVVGGGGADPRGGPPQAGGQEPAAVVQGDGGRRVAVGHAQHDAHPPAAVLQEGADGHVPGGVCAGETGVVVGRGVGPPPTLAWMLHEGCSVPGPAPAHPAWGWGLHPLSSPLLPPPKLESPPSSKSDYWGVPKFGFQ